MAVVQSDYISLAQIKGADTPIADLATGASRTLTDLGTTSTPPRSASYSGIRGAEFRTSSFSASTPQCLGCAVSTGLNTALYVSSKIQTFTWLARFRPSKSGLTSFALTPLGGLFSATNMGGTAHVYNQPCYVLIRQAAGVSRVIVSVMGAILDTTIATQDSGAVTTTPSDDAAWQTIGVIVTGNASTNNQIDSVKLVHVNAAGIRRVYSLGAHRAAALVTFTTNPSAGNTFTVNGRAYTFEAALLGTAATGSINGSGTNPADGDTVTVGADTFTFKNSVGAATRATAIIEWNSAATISGSTKAITFVIAGYSMKIIFSSANASGQPAGAIDNEGYTPNLNAKKVFECFHGDHDGQTTEFQIPATPSSGYDSGRSWADRRWSTGIATGLQASYTNLSYEIPICALAAGAAGNSIGVAVTDPNGTWVARVKAGTTSGGLMIGGADAPPAKSVKIGANWAATKASLIKAINATGVAGTDYSADITTANAIATASDPGGNNVTLTSKLLGTAGNGQTLSESSAQLTVTAFAGGVDGADADRVLIGATAAASFNNLISALNLTGTKGIDYGSPTTINSDVTASLQETGKMLLVAKAAGASGNSVTLATTVSGCVIKDEFGDLTGTTLVGGTAAPPLTVAAGARPDNSDLRIFVGGFTSAPAYTAGTVMGTVSDVGLVNRALSAEEVAAWGFTPPAASTRDLGWNRAPHQVRIAAKAEVTAAWHVPIALATGALNPRVDINRYGSRFAFRLYSIGCGRPMECNAFAFSYQREGGVNPAARGGYYQFPEFSGGVVPNLAKPLVPGDSMYDLMNMSLHQGILRTRRGYRILAGVGTSVTNSPCAFYDATNSAGETYHLFFAGGTIYAYDNGNLVSVDSDWPANEIPTCATVGLKTFFFSSTRRRVFIAGTFYAMGVDAPTTAPSRISEADQDGGVVATAPGVEYIVTYYDGTKLTDSGQSPVLTLILPPGTPPKAITLGIPIAASSSVTARNIWRRKRGDVNNVFQFVGTVEDNTTTTFVDDSEIPGIETLEDFGGLAVTADDPGGTACAAWNGKLVVWGLTDKRQILISELGDGERFWPGSVVTCDGAVRGTVPSEGRNLVFTDKTVESIEGDFLRSPDGDIGITRHVLDPASGSFGPFAQCVAGGRVFWANTDGIRILQTGAVLRDVSQEISWPVLPIIDSAVDTLGTNVVLEYIAGQLWCLLTQTTGSNSDKNRIVLVLDLERRRWTIFDHQLSHVARVRDGIYGTLLVGSDYYGNALELDVYDGDGCQGNESWYPASPSFSSVSVAGKTVTFSSASFPTTGNGLRGVSVILEDVSAGVFYRQTILSNTGTVLTLDDVPSAIASGDKCHIGAIYGMMETKEVDAGTLDNKVLREAAVGLVDADSGAF